MYRTILIGTAFLCCVLVGCRKEEKEPVTITLTHAWGGTEPDHLAMRSIYEKFEKQNPDIHLQFISMPTRNELIRKVEDMIMVGNMPDIVNFSGMGQNVTYDFMIKNNMALNLTPYIEADPEFKKSISKTNLKYWTTENRQLFTVSDVLSLSGGYWYNEDIFSQAGITEIPKTWDEFLTTCESIHTWSERESTGVKPLQPSAEGYLYFMNHLMEEDAHDTPAGVQKHKLYIHEEELSKAIDCLKNVYNYTTLKNTEYSYRDETGLFNEGKVAIYVNGVWGASMISQDINAAYALIPTVSGKSMSCESTCLGYVLGNSGNKEKQEASVRFLKYMLSEDVQRRILEGTEQIPSNPEALLDDYKETKPRLFQGASLVLNAEKKIQLYDNFWTLTQKTIFSENIYKVLAGEQSVQEFEGKLE